MVSLQRSFLSAVPVLLLGLGAALGACGGSDDDEESAGAGTPQGITCGVAEDKSAPGSGPPLLSTDCDPISSHCGMPFPSNVYLLDDPDKKNPSGKSVRFGKTTLPRYQGDKENVDATLFYDSDGFSPGQAPMARLGNPSATGLATPDTIESTIKPDSPTILLDADSGQLVPHFVDIDQATKSDDERSIMLRPVVRLKDKTRYIVAIRKVVDADGKEIEPTAAFKALRDGGASCHPSVDLRRDLYKDIFAKLEAAGVKKDGLQIAWDYTTATRENNTGWLVAMRDEALAKYGSAPFKYKIDKVDENPNQYIAKRVHAKVTMPLYLSQPGPWNNGETVYPRMNLGPDGKPAQNGEFEFDVLIHIPNTIKDGTKHGLLQNGHGLLGSRFEGQNGYLAEMAGTYKWIAFSVNLMGFSEDDVPVVTAGLGGTPIALKSFIERQVQGQLNQLLAMRFMMTTFANDPLLQVNGQSVVDAPVRAYRGDSQGGIMGTTYMAVSTDVTRGLVGEPGMPYNLLLNRSRDYAGYQLVLNGSYRNGFDQQLLLGLIQMFWDRSEPDGYAPYISENMLPNTPKHDLLIHVARGDQQVSNLGAHIIARAVKAKSIKPAVRPIWGIEEADTVKDGSAIAEYSFALPDEPKTNVAATVNPDPHDFLRELTPSYKQSDHFFRTGEVIQYCDGVCSCFDDAPEDHCMRFECENLQSYCSRCPAGQKDACEAGAKPIYSDKTIPEDKRNPMCQAYRQKQHALGCPLSYGSPPRRGDGGHGGHSNRVSAVRFLCRGGRVFLASPRHWAY